MYKPKIIYNYMVTYATKIHPDAYSFRNKKNADLTFKSGLFKKTYQLHLAVLNVSFSVNFQSHAELDQNIFGSKYF